MTSNNLSELDEIYLSDRQVARRYETSRALPWRWAAQGNFPKPIKLSERITRWKLSDLVAWEREVA